MHHSDKYRRLARLVWKAVHGAIPAGHQIHHKDLDDRNYRLDNLECLPIVEHRRRHAARPKTLICQRCDKAFVTAWTSRALYCSDVCKAAARRSSGIDNEERCCSRCGKLFTVNRYAKQKYCSRGCVPSYERKVMRFTCRMCRAEFMAHDARALYCSVACRKRFDRRKRMLDGPPAPGV